MNQPWSLDALYTSFEDPAFLADVSACDALISDYETFSTRLKNTKDLRTDIVAYLVAQQELNRHFEKLFSFCSLSMSANTKDEAPTTYLHLLQEKVNKLTEAQITIQEFLGHLEDVDSLVTGDTLLENHAYFLKDLARFNPYLLSAKR